MWNHTSSLRPTGNHVGTASDDWQTVQWVPQHGQAGCKVKIAREVNSPGWQWYEWDRERWRMFQAVWMCVCPPERRKSRGGGRQRRKTNTGLYTVFSPHPHLQSHIWLLNFTLMCPAISMSLHENRVTAIYPVFGLRAGHFPCQGSRRSGITFRT